MNYSKLFKFMLKKTFSVLLLLIIVGTVLVSSAQAALIPCGLNTDDPSTQGIDESQPCTICHMIIGIQRIVNYGMTLVVIAAIFAIVVAGIMYIISAGDEGLMQTAKGLLKNVLIGFALVLGAVVIVNIVMWVMAAKNDLGLTKDIPAVTGWTSWNNFSCSTASKTGTNQP